MFFRCLVASVLVVSGATQVQADGRFGYCRPTYCPSVSKSDHDFNVTKVANIEFVPTFVSFVPSQVLTNGQIVTYGSQVQTALGYSYQGNAVQAQPQVQQQAPAQQAPAQKQQQAAGATQVQGGTASDLECLKRIEAKLLELESRLTVTAQATGMSEGEMVLYASCKSCHSPGGSAEKSVVMFDASGKLLDKLPRAKIFKAVESGSMPPSGKLDSAKQEAVRKWTLTGIESLVY